MKYKAICQNCNFDTDWLTSEEKVLDKANTHQNTHPDHVVNRHTKI